MPKITNISYNESKDRYWIYVDDTYCTSIRARTFKGMKLSIGQVISCDEVKEMENFHFKNQYKDSWEQEKVRIKQVSELINSIDYTVSIIITGFGANSNDIIKEHPEEQGKPDIEIKRNGETIMFVEVTGTESMRGNDYWIRPDKLKYCQNHTDQNVWIILHYLLPHEKFVFIKPDGKKQYNYKVMNIRGTDEHYVSFCDSDPEVYCFEVFKDHLTSLIT